MTASASIICPQRSIQPQPKSVDGPIPPILHISWMHNQPNNFYIYQQKCVSLSDTENIISDCCYRFLLQLCHCILHSNKEIDISIALLMVRCHWLTDGLCACLQYFARKVTTITGSSVLCTVFVSAIILALPTVFCHYIGDAHFWPIFAFFAHSATIKKLLPKI